MDIVTENNNERVSFSRKDCLLFALAERAAPPLIRLWGRTTRWRWQIHPETGALLEREEAVVYAFWHGRMLPLVYSHRGRGAIVLVTRNRDGEFIARIIGQLGFGTIRGSSSRGGQEALQSMSDALRSGRSVAITPDGPRGPRHSVKPGILRLAVETGAPIVPTAASGHPARRLGSWDRFLIPRPFGRCAIVHGAPLRVPVEALNAVEPWIARVRDALMAVTRDADRLVGAGEDSGA